MELSPEVLPEPTASRPPPPSASQAPTIHTWRPPAPSAVPPKRRLGWRLLGTLVTLVIGVAGGLAIPYRVLDGVIPAEWLPVEATAPVAAAPPSAAASVSASASASEPAEAAPEPTKEELASRGDKEAIKELEAIPNAERTVDQNAALARGDIAGRLAELEKLGKALKKNPDLTDDEATMVTLLKYARDPHTTFAAQEIIAGFHNAAAADLLFEIWTGVPNRTPATILAERLITSAEVRKYASPALAVNLDLRDAKDCDTVIPLIDRVGEVGDVRSVVTLAKLTSRRDCGDKGREECFPCLRDREHRQALSSAALAAQKRRPPKY